MYHHVLYYQRPISTTFVVHIDIDAVWSVHFGTAGVESAVGSGVCCFNTVPFHSGSSIRFLLLIWSLFSLFGALQLGELSCREKIVGVALVLFGVRPLEC